MQADTDARAFAIFVALIQAQAIADRQDIPRKPGDDTEALIAEAKRLAKAWDRHA